MLVSAITTLAQDAEPIMTDRPTQSAAAATVGKGNLLIETGFIFENTDPLTNAFNVNVLGRYGVSDRVEVRLSTNYDRIDGDDFTVSGLGYTSLGTKVFLAEAENAIPDISVIAQLNLPTGEDNDETTGEIRLNFQNQLSTTFSLGYNLGLLLSPDRESETSAFYSVVLGASLGNGFSVFAEPYGFFNEPSDHRFNAGVIYLLSDRFQLDLSGGAGISDASPDSFVGFGAAFGF